ncbi:MAG: serine hydrolase domain-containing protein [Propionibacteriaceae bacterium]
MTDDDLPRSTPEEQGLPSAAIEALMDRLETDGLEPHSLMIIRHGHVVAEGWWTPYHRDGVQLLYSLSKSFTSTAVGLAVAAGHFALDDRIAESFPEAAVDAGPRARSLTVHQVLSMSTGHRTDSLVSMLARPDQMEAGFFDYEPEEPPGTWFVYDNGATFMAADLTQQHTGERLVDYLRPRLFDPIGVGPAAWQQTADGRDLGFTGLHVRTEAIARFGLLIMNDGVWRGEQLLPAGWAARATSALVDNSMNDGDVDWQQGYGYQFWQCRHGAVRGDGAFGQFCIMSPEHDAVVVITAATERMQAELDAVWEVLLPAFAADPLPPDDDAAARLTRRLAEAEVRPWSGTAEPSQSGPWRFTHQPTEDNPALTGVTVTTTDAGFALTIDDGGTVVIDGRVGSWPDVTSPYLATGGWTDPDTFEALVVAVETPHHLRLRGRLSAGTLDASWNVLPLRWRSLADLTAPF